MLCRTEIKTDSKCPSTVFEQKAYMYEMEGLYCNCYLTFKLFFKPNTSVKPFTVSKHDKDGSDTITN